MTNTKAIDLTKGEDHRLHGSCPTCGSDVTVRIDTLYTTFTGTCQHCGQPLAHRAPNGTYRTNVTDPGPSVWLINRRHYCAACRLEITGCACTPPQPVPPDYHLTSRPIWQHQYPVPEDTTR